MGKEAVKKQKELAGTEDGVRTLSTGVRVVLKPVPTALVEEVGNAVETPDPPMIMNEAKGREEPNPHDPAYKKALARYESERASAMMDAMIVFGVELVDGLPEDDGWVKQLAFVAQRTAFSLDQFDMDDPFEREFVYKKYVAMGTRDLMLLGQMAGLSQQDVQDAVDTFPGS